MPAFYNMRSRELQKVLVMHDGHVGDRLKRCRISAGWNGEELRRHCSDPWWVIRVYGHKPTAAIITLINIHI